MWTLVIQCYTVEQLQKEPIRSFWVTPRFFCYLCMHCQFDGEDGFFNHWEISLELRVPYLQTSDIHNQSIQYIYTVYMETHIYGLYMDDIYIYIYVPHHGVIRCSSNTVLEMFGPISQWIFVRWSMFSIFKVWPVPSLAVPVPTPWLNVSPLGLSESWVPQSPLVDNPFQN